MVVEQQKTEFKRKLVVDESNVDKIKLVGKPFVFCGRIVEAYYNNAELDSGFVTFKWESTVDVDPLDFVQYILMYTHDGGDTTLIYEILDTLYTIQLDDKHQYHWQVIASDKNSQFTYANGTEDMWSFVLGSLNNNNRSFLPIEFGISSIYPNPFNPVTNITYALPENVKVQILIFDIIGKQIESLINEFQSPGYHSVDWNADIHPSGIYFVKMIAGEYVNTQKLMLVK